MLDLNTRGNLITIQLIGRKKGVKRREKEEVESAFG